MNKQSKSKTIIILKIICTLITKLSRKWKKIIAVPDLEAASVKTIQRYTMIIVIFSQELGTSRAHFYALQEPFKKELERLQGHQILAPLGLDKTAEWCSSFVVMVPKPHGMVHLCLDPM